jgi:opacity protein-like surface antigen
MTPYSRNRRRLFVVSCGLVAGICVAARPSFAQQAGRWEASLFGGGSFGSRVSLTPTADSKIGISPAWGLRVSYGITKSFMLETSYSHAKPDLTSTNPATGLPIGSPTAVTINTYELNGLFGWGRGRWKGYAGLGLGAMTLDPSSSTAALPDSTTRFAANAALGTKYFVTDNLAFRLDARYRWKAAPSHVGTIVCGEEGCHTFTTDIYSGAEVTGGVTWRFGGPALGNSSGSGGDERFWRAAGELGLLIVGPWAFNRYVSNAEFAHISMDTVTNNYATGYTYDRDHFDTNQSSHPYHGSLFFNAARTNGFGFWESGAFAFTGSFLWEMNMEREPPSINDLVNTTMGGMTRGEIQYRLANVILDNTASGSNRFWREVGGAVFNPVGALNRLLDGEMFKDFPNPSDRIPSALSASADIGYRHNNGSADHPDQGIATFWVIYGDPFAGEIEKPFDTFRATVDLNVPGGRLVSRIEERGILKGWELTEKDDPTRHILAVNQEYIYLSNEAQEVGAQMFTGSLLSRFSINDRFKFVSQVSLLALPMAAVRTTDALNPVSGRNFDYGPGGGARIELRLLASGREAASVGYAAAWTHTTDGSTNNNALQFLRVVGRIPIAGKLGAGAAYNWYSRKSTYANFFEATHSQSEWRVFGSWVFF